MKRVPRCGVLLFFRFKTISVFFGQLLYLDIPIENFELLELLRFYDANPDTSPKTNIDECETNASPEGPRG